MTKLKSKQKPFSQRYLDWKRETGRYIKSCRPYWRHVFSKTKLRGSHVTWCFGLYRGWFRVGQWIWRWERIKRKS